MIGSGTLLVAPLDSAAKDCFRDAEIAVDNRLKTDAAGRVHENDNSILALVFGPSVVT